MFHQNGCTWTVYSDVSVWNPEGSGWVAMPDETLAKLQRDCGASCSHQGKLWVAL
jgi:hypothetical protein